MGESAACSAPASRRRRRSSASGASRRCAISPRSAKGRESEKAAYDAAATALAANARDVPFALIYRVADDGATAELDAAAGIEAGARGCARSVALGGADDLWGLGEVVRSARAGHARTDLAARFAVLPTGAWAAPAHTAMVLPVQLPGQDRPRAILVAGVSPMRALDDSYRTFFGLVATQIAAGLADAQALEEERRRAAALAEIDRAKTAFFSNVSHEFRTPLTLMLGPLEDLLANAHGPLPAEAVRTLTLAHSNSLRLLKLVNSLLDFARIEAGRVEASYEPTDLAAATAELASVFRSAVETRRSEARRRLRAARRAGLRRPRHVGEDRAESSLERVQVHVRGRDRSGAARARGDRIELTRSRHGRRNRRGRSAEDVPALPPRAQRALADARRLRHRPRARARARQAPWRRHRARKPRGRRHDVHGELAEGQGALAGRANRRRARARRRRGPARSHSSRKRCARCRTRPRSEPRTTSRARARRQAPAARPRSPARRRQRRHARLRAALARAPLRRRRRRRRAAGARRDRRAAPGPRAHGRHDAARSTASACWRRSAPTRARGRCP